MIQSTKYWLSIALFLSNNLFCRPNASIYSSSMFSLNNPSLPISHVSPLVWSSAPLLQFLPLRPSNKERQKLKQRTKARGDMWEIGKEGLLRENIELEYILAFWGQNWFFDKKAWSIIGILLIESRELQIFWNLFFLFLFFFTVDGVICKRNSAQIALPNNFLFYV